MVRKDKSYRFLLPKELFDIAEAKAKREDLNVAQVLRRLLRAWATGEIVLPPYRSIEGEQED